MFRKTGSTSLSSFYVCTSFILAIVLLPCLNAQGAVWYVNEANASGAEDGLSWETAFTDVQEAVDAAAARDGFGQVWVAAGAYRGFGGLAMAPNVDIYGGFAGNETVFGERDWERNETILRKGSPVVRAAADATLDGVSITLGSATGNGSYIGAALSVGTAARFAHCKFYENYPRSTGERAATVYIYGGSPVFEDCTFRDTRGQSVYVLDGTPVFRRCQFVSDWDTVSSDSTIVRVAGDDERPVVMFEDCGFFCGSTLVHALLVQEGTVNMTRCNLEQSAAFNMFSSYHRLVYLNQGSASATACTFYSENPALSLYDARRPDVVRR